MEITSLDLNKWLTNLIFKQKVTHGSNIEFSKHKLKLMLMLDKIKNNPNRKNLMELFCYKLRA